MVGLWHAASFFISNDFLRLSVGTIVIVAGFLVQLRYVHFNQWEKKKLHDLANVHKKVDVFLKWSGLSVALAEK